MFCVPAFPCFVIICIFSVKHWCFVLAPIAFLTLGLVSNFNPSIVLTNTCHYQTGVSRHRSHLHLVDSLSPSLLALGTSLAKAQFRLPERRLMASQRWGTCHSWHPAPLSRSHTPNTKSVPKEIRRNSVWIWRFCRSERTKERKKIICKNKIWIWKKPLNVFWEFSIFKIYNKNRDFWVQIFYIWMHFVHFLLMFSVQDEKRLSGSNLFSPWLFFFTFFFGQCPHRPFSWQNTVWLLLVPFWGLHMLNASA